jgi:hypothetical protein
MIPTTTLVFANNSIISVTMSGTITVSTATVFAGIVQQFIQLPSTSLQISASAQVTATMPIGSVSMSGVNIAPPATVLTGLNNIPGVVISGVSMASSTASSINVVLTASFNNPTTTSMTLGNFTSCRKKKQKLLLVCHVVFDNHEKKAFAHCKNF